MRISLASLGRRGRALGVEHELRDPRVVAKVDEDEPAVVTPARRPSGERQRLPDVLGACIAAHEVTPAHDESLSTTSSCPTVTSASPARRIVAPSAADHHGRRRTTPAGLRQLTLERALRVVGVARNPTPTEFGEPVRDARAGSVGLHGDVDRDPRRARHRRLPRLPSRGGDARCRLRSPLRASAGRRSPPRGSRSDRLRRASRSRSRAGRRTPRSCASSSRGRARGSARAGIRRRSHRGRAARRRSVPRIPRRATRRSSAPRREQHEPPRASPGSCRRPAAGSSPPSRSWPRRAGRRSPEARTPSVSRYAGRQARQPIELSSRWYCVTPSRPSSASYNWMSSASIAGSSLPTASTEACQCSRWRPFPGAP